MGPPAGISLAQPGDDPVWRAARKFEQMAIGQLLTPMFATVDLSQEAFGGGEGEAAWQPMMIDAMSRQIEARGGLGLAAPVHAEMLRLQEQVSAGAARPARRAR
jgi:Rod binding domain-containing protein